MPRLRHSPHKSWSAFCVWRQTQSFRLPSRGPRGEYPGPVPVKPLLGDGLVTRRIRVRSSDVVYVKAILEASEGIGALFAERGGELVVATPDSRESALDELLSDLVAEIDAVVARD